MRFLILASPADRSALLVAAALRQRYGMAEVGVISPDALGMVQFWEHRGFLTGKPATYRRFSTTFRLSDGQIYRWPAQGDDTNSPQVIFNRLTRAQVDHFAHADPADRDYALFETFALWLSWLHCLTTQGVTLVNEPSPRQLCGPGLSQLEWLALAARCRLPVLPITLADRPVATYQQDTHTSAFLGDVVLPDRDSKIHRMIAAGPQLVPSAEMDSDPDMAPDLDHLRPGIARLQQASRCPLLELYLVHPGPYHHAMQSESAAGCYLAGVNPLPELSLQGDLSAVVDLLVGFTGGIGL